jgi:hypothetical protein
MQQVHQASWRRELRFLDQELPQASARQRAEHDQASQAIERARPGEGDPVPGERAMSLEGPLQRVVAKHLAEQHLAHSPASQDQVPKHCPSSRAVPERGHGEGCGSGEAACRSNSRPVGGIGEPRQHGVVRVGPDDEVTLALHGIGHPEAPLEVIGRGQDRAGPAGGERAEREPPLGIPAAGPGAVTNRARPAGPVHGLDGAEIEELEPAPVEKAPQRDGRGLGEEQLPGPRQVAIGGRKGKDRPVHPFS